MGLTAVTLITVVRAVCPAIAAQVLADASSSLAHEHPWARCQDVEREMKSMAAPFSLAATSQPHEDISLQADVDTESQI